MMSWMAVAAVAVAYWWQAGRQAEALALAASNKEIDY